MSEAGFRRLLLIAAMAGLAVGLALPTDNAYGLQPAVVWTIATIPVVLVLTVSIVRDFLIGRFGVDAIALVSMVAALLLGQPLAGVVVAIMYSGGTVLEDYARGRAQRDLAALTERSPRVAHRQRGETLETIAADQVAVGDELLVRAGELLPVDGELIGSPALIDESAVTGEPLPRKHIPGDLLRSGTINADDAFHMRATALAQDSTYAAIVRMVAAAQTSRAPFIRLADRFAVIMLPLTLALAGLAWYLSGDPVRALAVFVIATPCPLILAAPVAFISGVSHAARHGVLMKGSAALEGLAEVRTAIFDKTGTLTYGGAELLDAAVAPRRNPQEMLRLLASLEQASHHVLAESIVATARGRGLTLSRPVAVREYRGSGLEGQVDGIDLRIGSRALVLSEKPLPKWAGVDEARYTDQPVLRVYVALNGKLAAIFTFGDALRPDAVEVCQTLRSQGIDRVVMLTGDDTAAAMRIAANLEIDKVIANASPADKLNVVGAERAQRPVMMVGDGINDAPALASANVGIAMGARGATAASQAADIIILTNRLQLVAEAVLVARRTMRIAKESIFIGLGLAGTAMIAAAFGYIPPVTGALLQEGIDIAVILNALRALGEVSHFRRRTIGAGL